MDIYQKIDIVLIATTALCAFLSILKIIVIVILKVEQKYIKRKCERIRLGNRINAEVVTLIEFSAPLVALIIFKWICWGHA